MTIKQEENRFKTLTLQFYTSGRVAAKRGGRRGKRGSNKKNSRRRRRGGRSNRRRVGVFEDNRGNIVLLADWSYTGSTGTHWDSLHQQQSALYDWL